VLAAAFSPRKHLLVIEHVGLGFRKVGSGKQTLIHKYRSIWPFHQEAEDHESRATTSAAMGLQVPRPTNRAIAKPVPANRKYIFSHL